jgi:hypothetical protein
MLTLRLPARSWQLISAGAGAKGQRIYHWALLDIPTAGPPGQHWLLEV